MGSKIAAAVVAAVLLMASGAGVYIWASSKTNAPETTDVTATDSTSVTVADADSVTRIPGNSETQSVPNSEYPSGGSDVTEKVETGENDMLLSSDDCFDVSFTVIRITDTTTDSDVQAREVLGDGYEGSYLKLNPDYSFIMTLGYKDKRGSYSVDSSSNTINVTYDSGDTDAFSYSTDDTGSISYVMVPYGDYQIYFGN